MHVPMARGPEYRGGKTPGGIASSARQVSAKKPPSFGCGFSFSNAMISSAVIQRSSTRPDPLSQAGCNKKCRALHINTPHLNPLPRKRGEETPLSLQRGEGQSEERRVGKE